MAVEPGDTPRTHRGKTRQCSPTQPGRRANRSVGAPICQDPRTRRPALFRRWVLLECPATIFPPIDNERLDVEVAGEAGVFLDVVKAQFLAPAHQRLDQRTGTPKP